MNPNLIFALSLFGPLLLFVLIAILYRWWSKRDGRRSPLTGKLQHAPGEQLLARIQKHDQEVDFGFMLVMLSVPLFLLTWALQVVPWDQVRFGIYDGLFVVAAAAMFCGGAWYGLRHVGKRRHAREGRAAELATAQYLMPLMAEGCLVYHDIPAGKFNLDHVVIGPFAVFVLETKSRRKPRGGGTKSAEVTFDGTGLRFPDHAATKPVEQARHQARWLSDELRGAAGEPVPVIPVVTLPGWFVKPGKDAHRSDVRVINPKMHSIFFDSRGGAPLSTSLRTRIAHALTQRYPDAE